MRLLNVHDHTFREFHGENIPAYIITSHRWTDDETTFKDVLKKRNRDSKGWRKIEGFCARVREDNELLKAFVNATCCDWLWIDTACIDKRSSTELQESINSMMAWYRGSQECHAYMQDVRPFPPDRQQQLADVLDDYKNSEWFKRGWTLQELLAPRCVVFFTQTWEVIGQKCSFCNDKRSCKGAGPLLNSIIAEITRIPEEVLRDFERSEPIGVEEKMKWSQGRRTTRIEDRAYCLLGLFDVHMPLLYGDGEKAFSRLERTVFEELERPWRSQLRLSFYDLAGDDLGAPHSSGLPTAQRGRPLAILPFSDVQGEVSCICGYMDDDGSLINCNLCYRWQHALCYYPENADQALAGEQKHGCIDCRPRSLDAATATARQRSKRVEGVGGVEGVEVAEGQEAFDAPSRKRPLEEYEDAASSPASKRTMSEITAGAHLPKVADEVAYAPAPEEDAKLFLPRPHSPGAEGRGVCSPPSPIPDILRTQSMSPGREHGMHEPLVHADDSAAPEDGMPPMSYIYPDFEVKDQDRCLPIANVARIMKRALPDRATVAKEAKGSMQECVSKFISIITSEATKKCQQEKRETVDGEDILSAMKSLGFENYGEALRIYLARYREQQTPRGHNECSLNFPNASPPHVQTACGGLRSVDRPIHVRSWSGTSSGNSTMDGARRVEASPPQSSGLAPAFTAGGQVDQAAALHEPDLKARRAELAMCPIPSCGRAVRDLKAHMGQHQVDRPEKCPVPTCEYHTKGFARQYDQARHTLTHYRGEMTCGFCISNAVRGVKTFNRADVFKRHLTSVHGVEQKPQNARGAVTTTSVSCPATDGSRAGECSICATSFASPQGFYDHLDECVLSSVTQQQESSNWTCPEYWTCLEFGCASAGVSFARKADLERHFSTVHGDSQIRLYDIPCPYPGCDRKGERGFARRDKMLDHQRKAHGVDVGRRG